MSETREADTEIPVMVQESTRYVATVAEDMALSDTESEVSEYNEGVLVVIYTTIKREYNTNIHCLGQYIYVYVLA